MPGLDQLTYPWVTSTLIAKSLKLFNNTHALLLSGGQGLGKSTIVAQMCQNLFVEGHSPQAQHLYEAGTHPDLHVLSSAYAWSQLDSRLQAYTPRYLDPTLLDKKRLSRQISIDSIRSLCRNMTESAAQGGKKIVVINLAEHMNISSSNALLKFLEEPTRDTLIILLSHDVSRLSATIRSRCVNQQINSPQDQLVFTWLKTLFEDKSRQAIQNAFFLAAKRPLIAKKMLESDQQLVANDLLNDVLLVISSQANIIELARKWLKYKQTDFIVDWLIMLISDIIKLSAVDTNQVDLYNQANLEKLSVLCNSIDTIQAFSLYDQLCKIKQRYDGVSDQALLLEDILIQLQHAKRLST